jgi:Fic family protein
MFTFLNNLDPDLRTTLLNQLRNLWTHTSTAIEGNTLTLGETAFVLDEGLTVSGKPLRDHREVVGHARAIDLLYQLLQKGKEFGGPELFALHAAVQTEVVVDVYKPVGGWKKEANSTTGVVDGKQVIFDYAPPDDVPALMDSWFNLYRDAILKMRDGEAEQALTAYARLHVAFVRIHPFFDGNGRMARLIANLPVLKAGLPPIIIPGEQRKEYIDLLAAYHFKVGQIRSGDELLPHPASLKPFIAFCQRAWQQSLSLVEMAQETQRKRKL